MPGLFHQPHDRRAFLKTAALGGAAFLLPLSSQRVLSAANPAELHLALLSDTHVPGDPANGYRGFSPGRNLRQIVPDVRAVRPEGVIINGDAARLEGFPEDYAELRRIVEPLAQETPVVIGLGNHDDRANFAKAFSEPPGIRPPVQGKHVTVIEHEAVRVVVLDSLLYVNHVAGLIGREQRDWLSSYLPQAADRPLVLMVHHTLGDGDGDLLDVDRLFALLQPHPHVKAIFYGHSHVWNQDERQGVKLINLPAVGYNFRDQDPVGWVEARFRKSGVSLTLHAFAGNRADDGGKINIPFA